MTKFKTVEELTFSQQLTKRAELEEKRELRRVAKAKEKAMKKAFKGTYSYGHRKSLYEARKDGKD